MWFRNLQTFLFFQLLMLLGLSAPLSAAEGKRLALVVGNSSYTATTPLANAAADARAFAAFLKENGFEVDSLINVDRAGFARGLSTFSKKIGPADTALFYFAGHGMQLKGENFLLGLDAELLSEFDVDAEAIALNSITGIMERKASLSLLFVDACRNNPIADRLNASVEGVTRGAALKGLAPVSSTGSGTMIAFSASPGQVAYDGVGENSPFTTALVEHLSSPSLEVGTAFKRVIRDVRIKTNNLQSPQIVSNIAAEFYFNASAPATAVAASDFLAQIDFEKAERIATARGWQLYLAKHQSGSFSDSARAALRLLEGGGGGLVSPQEAESRMKLTQSQRKEIQLTLSDLGYDIGAADGNFGQKTRRAISRYQKALGLTETGYVNSIVANRLELVGVTSTDSAVSADEARLFDPEDLKGLETDERTIRAAQCLRGKEIIYGEFGSRLYVAVYDRHSSWQTAKSAAQRCEAHLASISSKAENDFIYGLFETDDRMFETGFDGSVSYKMGPWIGLEQDPGAREPRGGWRWLTGEPMTYNNWLPNHPNEHKQGDDFAMFYAHLDGNRDTADLKASTWDDMGPQNSSHGYIIEFR
ncbi:MAG: hypothetical protein E5Y63_30260 [Mesorhizobium sp.]|uniref:caspase family protein n=1 Tax=Mesorhizobium sp. TaxID=1871066 RepID=UPI0011FBAE54|nr:caspase family protein [Mesorhizobium sp.]TIM26282.1 MAG: hypothetical protein E5Y63_30260 [Mesorhizobium sp.]